jgi:hypothetical protein
VPDLPFGTVTEQIRGVYGYELGAVERELADVAQVRLEPMLGSDSFTREWSRGESLDLDAAVDEALGALD